MYFLKKMLGVGSKNQEQRERWLRRTLSELDPGSRILDAGAGELQYKKFCDHLKYVSQDFAQYDGVGDRRGLQTDTWDNSKVDIVSDITSIPVENGSFDAIMCVEVFEHIPHPIQAVKEFSRILKSGGTLIITAPFCSFTHFAPYFFYTGYSSYWYKKVLSDHAFEVLEITKNGNFFEYLIQEMRRVIQLAFKYSRMNFLIKLLLCFFYLLLLPFVLMVLKLLSKFDSGSDDVVCFGLQVVAKKL